MNATRRPAAAPRRHAARLAVLAAGVLLAACSPEHDWREVRADDAGYTVMLPAKPASLTRPIHLEAMRVDMGMQGAQAGGVSYTVGSVRLPDDGQATRERALAAMRAAMVRNIGGTERAVRPVAVTVVDATGRQVGTAEGVEVEAVGRMRDGEAVLFARFVGIDARAWQAVALGPRADREQAALFLESLKLRR